MVNWTPPEFAPKDGTQIIAVFESLPFPVMAVWCGAAGMWCAAVPQVFAIAAQGGLPDGESIPIPDLVKGYLEAIFGSK